MKGNQEMTYFSMVAYASTAHFVNIRCYQKHRFSALTIGRTYNFNGMVEKDVNNYWMVSSSTAGLTSKVDLPVELNAPLLPEDMPKAGMKRKLNVALSLGSELKSTVTA